MFHSRKSLVFLLGIMILVLVYIGIRFKSGDTSMPEAIVASEPFDWGKLDPKYVLDFAQKRGTLTDDRIVYFLYAADLTGDSKSEGVFMGSGGNSDWYIILMQQDDGSIALAQLRQKDGRIFPVALSPGRAMINASFEILPQEKGFYQAWFSYDPENQKLTCKMGGLEAYTWNPSDSLFDWNANMTEKYSSQICK